jgi:hypothetical protein
VVDLLALPGKEFFPGTSLAQRWNDSRDSTSQVISPLLSEVNFAPDLPAWFPVSKGNMKSLVIDRYHYIKNGDGGEELYDIEQDPLEKHDLAPTVGMHTILKRFRTSLAPVLTRN